jgi:hypothetical protein
MTATDEDIKKIKEKILSSQDVEGGALTHQFLFWMIGETDGIRKNIIVDLGAPEDLYPDIRKAFKKSVAAMIHMHNGKTYLNKYIRTTLKLPVLFQYDSGIRNAETGSKINNVGIMGTTASDDFLDTKPIPLNWEEIRSTSLSLEI